MVMCGAAAPCNEAGIDKPNSAIRAAQTEIFMQSSLRKLLNIAASHGNRHSVDSCIISCVSSPRGKFITFEGLDGCGKSTQLERLAGKLRERGLAVTLRRERGRTPAGDQKRQLLLDGKPSAHPSKAELALMVASRDQHIDEIPHPALAPRRCAACVRRPGRL